MAALLIVPFAVVLVACNGGNREPYTPTPPNYEAVAKGHTFSTTRGFYIKTVATGYYATFSSTNKDIDTLIGDYLDRLDTEWYDDDGVGMSAPAVTAMRNGTAEPDFNPSDEDRIYDVFNSFINNRKFVLTPDADNKHNGTMKIIRTDTSAELATDITFTINNETGVMTFTGIEAGANWGKSYVSYTYKNGAITVEIDVAAIVKELATKYPSISTEQRNQCPALWLQFTLS